MFQAALFFTFLSAATATEGCFSALARVDVDAGMAAADIVTGLTNSLTGSYSSVAITKESDTMPEDDEVQVEYCLAEGSGGMNDLEALVHGISNDWSTFADGWSMDFNDASVLKELSFVDSTPKAWFEQEWSLLITAASMLGGILLLLCCVMTFAKARPWENAARRAALQAEMRKNAPKPKPKPAPKPRKKKMIVKKKKKVVRPRPKPKKKVVKSRAVVKKAPTKSVVAPVKKQAAKPRTAFVGTTTTTKLQETPNEVRPQGYTETKNIQMVPLGTAGTTTQGASAPPAEVSPQQLEKIFSRKALLEQQQPEDEVLTVQSPQVPRARQAGKDVPDVVEPEETLAENEHAVIWDQRPLGFGIQYKKDRQAYFVSSLQALGEQKGVVIGSKISKVNGVEISKMEFHEAGRALVKGDLPLKIVFEKPEPEEVSETPQEPFDAPTNLETPVKPAMTRGGSVEDVDTPVIDAPQDDPLPVDDATPSYGNKRKNSLPSPAPAPEVEEPETYALYQQTEQQRRNSIDNAYKDIGKQSLYGSKPPEDSRGGDDNLSLPDEDASKRKGDAEDAQDDGFGDGLSSSLANTLAVPETEEMEKKRKGSDVYF